MKLATATIRYADENDVHAIAKIHVLAWQKIYRGYIPESVLDTLSIPAREAQWLKRLSTNVQVFVIEQENSIVGFASFGPARDADLDVKTSGEISAIYLHPNFWHQGLGGFLLNGVLSALKAQGFRAVYLWVLKENIPARMFYESLGFIESEVVKSVSFDTVPLHEIRYVKQLLNQS